MSPISKLTILALASTVLAVPFAGHGHVAHGHLHNRQDAPAYGNGASSEASPVSTEAAAAAPPSYDVASSSVADAVPASSSAAAEIPSYNAASSSVADAVGASSAAPVYSYAPVASSEAAAVVPSAYIAPSSSVADAIGASSAPVYSYQPVQSSSEAGAVVPSTSCTSSGVASSEAAFTYAPINSTEAAAVPTAYQPASSVEQAATVSVKSSSAAASVPFVYQTVQSSQAAAVPTAYQSIASSQANAVPSYSTATTTVKTTRTTTVYTTLYLTSSSSQAVAINTKAASASVPVAAAASSNLNGAAQNTAPQCPAVVTVTATQKVTQYVTVTPGAASTQAAAGTQSAVTQVVVPQPATSSKKTVIITSTVYNNPNYHNSSSAAPTAYSTKSSQAAAIPSSSKASVSVPVYVVPSSSVANAVSTAPASAPVYQAPVSSVQQAASVPAAYSAPASSSQAQAVVPSTYAAVNKEDAQPAGYSVASSSVAAAISSSLASATASAPAAYSSTASSSSGKRGLAYNDASLTTCFSGSSQVTWGYNWGSSRDGLSSTYKFIPTLWGTRSDFTSVWDANVKECIAEGSEYIFSFNEPDHNEQASMSPADAASAYQTYMNPLKGQAKLCAPSVTNGGGSMGLTWLQSFLDSCGSNCEIDCLNVHWYDSASNVEYFKSHITQAISMANGKPIFVSEFGATGSDDEVAAFLEEVMPWMDSNASVAGYAYFMVKEGNLVTGGEPSGYGTTYKTYSS